MQDIHADIIITHEEYLECRSQSEVIALVNLKLQHAKVGILDRISRQWPPR